MALTFVRASGQRHVMSLLSAYYSSARRLGPVEVVVDAERRLKVWEDGFEPVPEAPLRLSVSPPSGGWIAIAFPSDVTFDLPLAAWLASQLRTETVAAYTWGDGYGLVAFDGINLTHSEGHIRDERSDMHLGRDLGDLDIPFEGDEDRALSSDEGVLRCRGWMGAVFPPRPWPRLHPEGTGRSS